MQHSSWQDCQLELKIDMTTDIPASITTPDQVDTRLGMLKFFDGFPSQDTVEKCCDNLLFMRAFWSVIVYDANGFIPENDLGI